MPNTSSTSGFILAGGQSRRMGRDKAELRWGATSLLDHMVQLLSTVAHPVRVVGRGETPDRLPGKGPLGGLLTALETTATADNLVLAVDLPLLTPDFLAVFHSRFLASPKPLLACRVQAAYPLCLGVRRSLMEDLALRIATDHLEVRRFIEENDTEYVSDLNPSIFANANTPGEFHAVLSRSSRPSIPGSKSRPPDIARESGRKSAFLLGSGANQ